MARIDINQALTLSFQHVQRIMFRPFVLKKWLALGFVSLFSASGGNYHFSSSSSSGDTSGAGSQVDAWLAAYWPLLIAGGIAILVLVFVFAWLASVLRFVFVDQITRNHAGIKEPFHRLKKLGTSYFLWTLGFGLVCMLALCIVVGLPLALVFAIISDATFAAKFAGVATAIGLGIPLLVAMACIAVLGNDFALGAMYVRNTRIMDAWRVVIPTIRANLGPVSLYLLFLILVALGSMCVAIPVIILLLIVFAIPCGLIFLACYGTWTALHLTWTPATISIGISLAIVAGAAFIYASHCVLAPVSVFRRSFALVVLGQADPTLITLPIAAGPATPSPSDDSGPVAETT